MAARTEVDETTFRRDWNAGITISGSRAAPGRSPATPSRPPRRPLPDPDPLGDPHEPRQAHRRPRRPPRCWGGDDVSSESREARAAAVLAEGIADGRVAHFAEHYGEPPSPLLEEVLRGECLRFAAHGAAALSVAGLLADPAPTAADGGLREAIKALCDEAEYVVLAVDDPGCSPVKAVAEIDLRAALAAHPAPDQQAVMWRASETPDFAALGRETVFTAEHWRRAWSFVQEEPRLWESVLAMVRHGFVSPVWAASALSKALAEPLRDLTSIAAPGTAEDPQ